MGGRSSLARLLSKERGARSTRYLTDLTPEDILAWADAHFQRTGRWPKHDSGKNVEDNGGTWAGVDIALIQGLRGLPGGSSLAKLLAEHRGVRYRFNLPDLTEQQILAWIDLHRTRTGEWPNTDSGSIAGTNCTALRIACP